MPWLEQPPLTTVLRRRENDGEPVNGRRLRARTAGGDLVRISPGSYAAKDVWTSLPPMAQHAQRVWEAAARLSDGRLFSHFAAAALHGIDILGRWPDFIDLTVGAANGGRSTGHVRRHVRGLSAPATIRWGRHEVTTPLQTAIDVIRVQPFIPAVATADQALWIRRKGGPLIAADELRDAANAVVGRGAVRAARAAAFASGQSDSIRESQSRAVISLLGFPAPTLQRRFTLSTGRDAYVDFFWDEYEHIGEFDGVGKYRDPELLRGRTPEQILLAEKDREDDLRRQVRGFSRWRTPQLASPRLLYDILTRAGLPTSHPRPGR